MEVDKWVEQIGNPLFEFGNHLYNFGDKYAQKY